ncbi:SWIM zinc finger family protein [Actinomadura flavalba]|uniref:SWIM zinc finger family protein n=1 Tax=Actinomadura flavalba TaxID=1120938 RepID=UPI0004775860|nr:SWIM zinc finger family protein [Actinomadura flavalba]
MSERWSSEHVRGLAPDAASAKAAATVAKPAKWSGLGCDGEAVWGECQGSGQRGYQACADLTEPAYRCSCPSRKFPCKHVLGLLLLWSAGTVPEGGRAPWAAEWLDRRRERTAAAPAKPKAADPKTAERREARVAAGLDDLDRWLCDQVAQGLAATESAPYRLWDDLARRLVDAQAGALAGQVRSLAALPRRPGWPDELLTEYALLRLLTRAARRPDLPTGLRATVRSRTGFTVPQEEVLASGERVRGRWHVLGTRSSEQEQLTVRRTWLASQEGRPALLLAFAAPGRAVEPAPPTGTALDAELAFYPGAAPLRAVVAEQHGVPVPALPPGGTVADARAAFAAALAAEPWLDAWPVVLTGVHLARSADNPCAQDATGTVPLRTADFWRLAAVSGGEPVTLTGEWTPQGLTVLACHHPTEGTVIV